MPWEWIRGCPYSHRAVSTIPEHADPAGDPAISSMTCSTEVVGFENHGLALWVWLLHLKLSTADHNLCAWVPGKGSEMGKGAPWSPGM